MKISIFTILLDIHESSVPNTRKCIGHIRANTTLPYELIIAENGTTHFKDEVDTFIYLPEFSRSSRNINLCMGAGYDSDYVIGVCNDAFVPPGWLEALLEVFEKKPLCGIATLNSSEFAVPCSNHILEDYGAAVFAMKRRMIDKVGYWDETFINSFEDIDYFIRAKDKGYTTFKNMRLEVEHIGGQTRRHLASHDADSVKNKDYFTEKHKGSFNPLYEMLSW